MLRAANGSPDGMHVLRYEAGEVYDLPASLAEVFLREGWAEEDKQLPGSTEQTAASAAPEAGTSRLRKLRRRVG